MGLPNTHHQWVMRDIYKSERPSSGSEVDVAQLQNMGMWQVLSFVQHQHQRYNLRFRVSFVAYGTFGVHRLREGPTNRRAPNSLINRFRGEEPMPATAPSVVSTAVVSVDAPK